MPRGDKTGPTGMGPMTGRAAGRCAGIDTPEVDNSAFGRGRGMGRGRGRAAGGCGRGLGRGMGRAAGGFGRGFRNQFLATTAGSAPEVNEKQVLTNQTKMLQAQIDAIRKRITEIES